MILWWFDLTDTIKMRNSWLVFWKILNYTFHILLLITFFTFITKFNHILITFIGMCGIVNSCIALRYLGKDITRNIKNGKSDSA